MVFIKGAWIDIPPWDDDYTKYFCCPGYNLEVRVVKRVGMNPLWQKELWCGKAKRYITDMIDGSRTCVIPDWCPLRVKDEGSS